MSNEIRADYDQLEQVASRFANQLQATQQMLQKVRRDMDQLHDGGWIGRGSDAFFNEMQGEVLPASQRLQDVLGHASQVTRAIIQIVQKADTEASSPFRNSR